MEVKLVTGEEDLRKTYAMRYQVYCREKKWFDEKEFPDGMEYDDDDSRSVHFAAYNDKNEMIASVRMICKTCDKNLPVEDHFQIGVNLEGRNIAEVSRLVVPRSLRCLEVTKALFNALFCWGIENGYDMGLAIIEEKLLRAIQYTGYPFRIAGEGKDYFGGFTYPVVMDIEEAMGIYQKKKEVTRTHKNTRYHIEGMKIPA